MVRASIATSLVVIVALASVACDRDKREQAAALAAQPASSTSPATAGDAGHASDTPTMLAAEAGRAAPKNEPVVTFKNVGLATPESVLYDDANDVYVISNINGKPLDADNNGFISKFTPDGNGATLKWIEGGKNKVTLNAPKGMAFLDGFLYVADLDTVRIFDRKTGAPAGEVKVPGAVFLNDVAVTTDGRILVSDTGMKASAKGFEPAGTDAVYAIDRARKLTTVAKAGDLGAPNGLLPSGDKIWVATFGTNELYALDAKGKKGDVQKLPKGSLDGIVRLPSGDLLVSSWEANAVYRGKPNGDFTPVIENVKSPADIGYDPKRMRVLVPLFESNEMQAYDIK
jgi:DNA-binding beta-propeller fold protein YncE